MNIASFPYDEQNCVIKFGTWSYDSSQVDLVILRTYPVVKEGQDDLLEHNLQAMVARVLRAQ